MPVYDYKCKSCGVYHEIFSKKIIHENEKPCEKCGGTMERQISQTNMKFIGPGFYCNDSKLDPNRDPKTPTPIKDIKEKLGR